MACGRVQVVANPNTHRKSPNGNLGSQSAPVCNVLNCIDGLTTTLSRSLSESTLRCLVQSFCSAHENFIWITNTPSHEMIKAAQADLASASQSILGTAVHYGLSRWSSLQATEKFYKIYISTKGAPFDKIHNLIALNKTASSFGFEGIAMEILTKVNCTAAVRYDGSSTLKEAFDAYWAALEACGFIAREIIQLK
jgi:hypothetical protein